MPAGTLTAATIRRLRHASGVFILTTLAAGEPLTAWAQTPPPPPAITPQAPKQAPANPAPPDTDYAPPPPAVPARIPATGFVMPDLPDNTKNYTSYDSRWVSTAFSVVPLVDYNAFVQDSDSKTQVGEQNDEWDLRTLRLMFRGQMKFRHPVDYLISVEVKGQDHVQNDASQFGFTDFELSTAVGRLGRLKFGKIKEPFVYEMVGDAANLQQQERALSPFFASRGIGLRLLNTFAHDRVSWSVGWFNDWWTQDQQFKVSGNDFAGRLTGVPYFTNDGSNYLHLGIGTRYIGEDEGTLRFRGRPESNVSDYYVDSGEIEGDNANELDLESVWGQGPFFLSAEYTRSWVDAPTSGNPSFWGEYVVVSYVLTGEHRPYDKKVAYARRILPQRRVGAFELVGRYSHVDLDDALVAGGIFDRGTIGINWWATRRWKVGFDYGIITLDRDGLKGITHAFHTRFQWVY
jgi:phosphate-selective porin